MIVIILVLNVAMVAAFCIFYRNKKKYWSKRVGVAGTNGTIAQSAGAPPLPSRPNSSPPNYATNPGVSYKNPYQQPQGVTRQRISSLHSSLASLPRGDTDAETGAI